MNNLLDLLRLSHLSELVKEKYSRLKHSYEIEQDLEELRDNPSINPLDKHKILKNISQIIILFMAILSLLYMIDGSYPGVIISWLLTFVFVMFAVNSFYRGFRVWQLREQPLKDINAGKLALLRLRIVESTALRAPLSNRSCGYWHLIAQERSPMPQGRQMTTEESIRGWEGIGGAWPHRNDITFADGSGRCVVQPLELDYHMREDYIVDYPMGIPASIRNLFPQAYHHLINAKGKLKRVVEKVLLYDQDYLIIGKMGIEKDENGREVRRLLPDRRNLIGMSFMITDKSQIEKSLSFFKFGFAFFGITLILAGFSYWFTFIFQGP